MQQLRNMMLIQKDIPTWKQKLEMWKTNTNEDNLTKLKKTNDETMERHAAKTQKTILVQSSVSWKQKQTKLFFNENKVTSKKQMTIKTNT